MAEAGEEEKPKRCRCGFWGSPQTMDMCSKCYKEYVQQGKTAKVEGGQSNASTKKALLQQLVAAVNENSSSSEVFAEKSDNQAEGEKREEGGSGKEGVDSAVDPFLPENRPQQKSKKKCWICKSKLELAQRELGTCKCGYVFCFLHRLPEQHKCIYDHKEGGRQQAMKGMVPAGKKKIGRSFHRMDSRPE